MSECYDGKLCEEKHKRIDEKLELNKKRLNDHSDRLDRLEQRETKVDEKIEHLCEQIKSLVNTLSNTAVAEEKVAGDTVPVKAAQN